MRSLGARTLVSTCAQGTLSSAYQCIGMRAASPSRVPSGTDWSKSVRSLRSWRRRTSPLRRAHYHYSTLQDGQLVAECIHKHDDSWDLYSVPGGYVHVARRTRSRSVDPTIPIAIASQRGWEIHPVCYSLSYRGKKVEELCSRWQEVLDDPNIEGQFGHNPLPWEGYTWSYDSGFVDDRLTLAERDPWVVSNTITPMSETPWRAHAWDDDQDRHDDDPAYQDFDENQSVDSDDGDRARLMIDSGTTFHIFSEKDAERAGMTRILALRRRPLAPPTLPRTRPTTRTSCSRARIYPCPRTYSRPGFRLQRTRASDRQRLTPIACC